MTAARDRVAGLRSILSAFSAKIRMFRAHSRRSATQQAPHNLQGENMPSGAGDRNV